MTTQPNDRFDRYEVTDPSGQAVFDITFPVADADYIRVYLDGDALPAVDYTVDIGALTVTLNTAAAQGMIVTLEGFRDIERDIDYPLRGDLRSSLLNRDMDAITQTLQELRRDVDRAMSLNKAESQSVSVVMPRLSHGRVIVWGDDGLENGPTTEGIDELADITADIQAVAAIKDQVVIVAGIDTQVAGVYDVRTEVVEVYNRRTDVTNVSGNMNYVQSVASEIDGDNNIAVVGTNIAQVRDVGNNISSVVAVANELAGDNKIGIVADNITSVITAADNMAAIIAAPGFASAAADSAALAEYWANQAEAIVDGHAIAISTDDSNWHGLVGENVQETFDNLDPLFTQVTTKVDGTLIEGFEDGWPSSGVPSGWSINSGNTTVTKSTAEKSQGATSAFVEGTVASATITRQFTSDEGDKRYAIDIYPVDVTNLTIAGESRSFDLNQWNTYEFDVPPVGAPIQFSATDASGPEYYIDNLREIVEVTETQSKAQIVVDGDYRGYDVLTSGDVHSKMLEGKPFIIQGVVAGFTNAPMSYGTSIVGLIQPKTISANLTVYEYTPLGFPDMGLNQWIRRDNSVDNWTVWLPQNDLPSSRFQAQTVNIGSNTTGNVPFDGYLSVDWLCPSSALQVCRCTVEGVSGRRGTWIPFNSGTGAGNRFTTTIEVNKGEPFTIFCPTGSSDASAKFIKSNRTI